MWMMRRFPIGRCVYFGNDEDSFSILVIVSSFGFSIQENSPNSDDLFKLLLNNIQS